HHLVVRDRDLVVDQRDEPLVGEEARRAVTAVGRGDTLASVFVVIASLAAVENDPHLDAALARIEEGLGDRRRGEAVGLDQNLLLRGADLADDPLRAVLTGREARLDRRRDLARERRQSEEEK